MTIMNASHEYEAARETFKAGDQRTLSSKIFKLHDFLMMHSFSFRHCDEENEVNVHRVHEATLFMATFSIFSKHADRAIEDPTRPIEEETALARIRVNALIRRAVLYIQQCKELFSISGIFLWAETHQSALSAYHSALTLANSLALSQDSFIILLI